MLPEHGYMRNNLVHLRGYLTHRDIADMPNLFLFCVYMIKGMTLLPRSHLAKQNGMNKNLYKHLRQPVETKIMQMCMYQFKITKNLFLSRGYKRVSSLARWNRLYIDTNVTERDHLSGYFFHINTQLLCHRKNFLYASCTFSVLS